MTEIPGYKHGGLRHKYEITKVNGKPLDPASEYFVLRVDKDPHARQALIAYQLSLLRSGDNPELAADLALWLNRICGGKR